MTRSIESGLRSAFVASTVVAFAACAGAGDDGEADWSGDTAAQGDELRRSWRGRHPLPPEHSTGVEARARGLVDVSGECEVCARAQACCGDVQAGALCTFGTSTCAALEPAARAAYVENCKVLIQTVASVRSVLPDSCR